MEENFDIFNLNNEDFLKQEVKGEEDVYLYKPYPEFGKDGIYKSIIRFVPNVFNPKKSKIHYYYVWLKDPIDGTNFKVFCPSTVGKKSILKDLYWKLKNSSSAKDQELAKNFSRKEDFYSLIQIVKDPNRPDLEGKIMYFKFGKKVNDLIEQQIKPEFGNPTNPYDLFEGKNFGLHVRKVGDWNNYDLCSFIGDKCPITIDGKPVEKTEEGKIKVIEYLKTGPSDLDKFEYRDWTPEENDKIMRIIRNTIPDLRIVSEILGTNPDPSISLESQKSSNLGERFFEETKSQISTTSFSTEDFLEDEIIENTSSKVSNKKTEDKKTSK